METKQPIWHCIGHIGDVDPIAFGGGFIYEDKTGIYPHEIAYFEPSPDEDWLKYGEDTTLKVYRLIIEEDSSREWWYEKLDRLVSLMDDTLENLQEMANSSDIRVKASLYELLVQYFGIHEFDSYPIKTTEGKAYIKYKKEMERIRRIK